jgi:hypothetical protein
MLYAGLLGALWAFHVYDRGQALHAQEKLIVERLKASEEADRRSLENRLNATHVKELDRRDKEMDAIGIKLNNALSELRTRPKRSDPPLPSPATPSCTGRELYREDGEFLAREAARAQKALVDRDWYYNEYENARKMLNENKPK